MGHVSQLQVLASLVEPTPHNCPGSRSGNFPLFLSFWPGARESSPAPGYYSTLEISYTLSTFVHGGI